MAMPLLQVAGFVLLICLAITEAASAATETVVYSFKGGSDGAYPLAGLINVNGTLYGTTSQGGVACTDGNLRSCGTVFSITQAGVERVLYAFKGGTTDGARPVGGLVSLGGTLYGTTEWGGNGANSLDYGYGTVFAVTKRGAERAVYAFAGLPDGIGPNA